MKTKSVVIALLLSMGGFVANVSAQKALDALAKKCKTVESVDMDVIRNKDKNKKEQRSVVRIRIKDNETLVNEFIAAFKKDEEFAIWVSKQMKSGSSTSYKLRFEDGGFYNMDLQDKANASVSIMSNGAATASFGGILEYRY